MSLIIFTCLQCSSPTCTQSHYVAMTWAVWIKICNHQSYIMIQIRDRLNSCGPVLQNTEERVNVPIQQSVLSCLTFFKGLKTLDADTHKHFLRLKNII